MPNQDPTAVGTPDRARMGTKARIAIVAAFIMLCIIIWMLVSALTARPAPDTTVRDRMAELTNSVQPDPNAPSRYEDLKSALAQFEAALDAIAVDLRTESEATENNSSPQWDINFHAVREGPPAGDPHPDRTLENARRALAALEQRAELDSITRLLRSPNLSHQYGSHDSSSEAYVPITSWLFEELSPFRRYVHAQVARARLASEAGDHQRASEILLEASPVPGVLTRQAFLVEQLVGNACATTLLEELNHLARQPGLETATLETMREVHRRLSDLGDITHSIRGERLFIEDIHYATHTAGGRFIPSAADTLLSSDTPDQPRSTLTRLGDVTGYLFARREASLRKADELYGQVEDALQEPDPATRDRLFAEIDAASDRLSTRYMLLQYIMPAISRASRNSLEVRAKLAHSEVLLAMAQHHAATGDWPTSLDQLIPHYLDAIPINPLTGKPFEFNHTPGEPPSLERLGL
ncbi:MAG: hypothetical protein ACNA8P_07130 [Phycisphaerales bacterium]